MDIHIRKRSRFFKPRLTTDCIQETLLQHASACWWLSEKRVCFTSKSNPRDYWNCISHGRSPDLFPFSDCLPNRWAVSDSDCVRKVAMELTVAGLFRIHTWFPFNRQRPGMPSSNQCDCKIKKFPLFRIIFKNKNKAHILLATRKQPNSNVILFVMSCAKEGYNKPCNRYEFCCDTRNFTYYARFFIVDFQYLL